MVSDHSLMLTPGMLMEGVLHGLKSAFQISFDGNPSDFNSPPSLDLNSILSAGLAEFQTRCVGQQCIGLRPLYDQAALVHLQ